MQLGLPQDKLQKCISLLHDTSSRRKIALRQLQSLIGNLNFACKAIRPGRAFLRRLIGRTIGVKQPHHKVYLTNQALADIHCWFNSCRTTTAPPSSSTTTGLILRPSIATPTPPPLRDIRSSSGTDGWRAVVPRHGTNST